MKAYETNEVQKDTVLFKEGFNDQFIYLIKSGEVINFKDHGGRIVPIQYCAEKDFVGVNDKFLTRCKSSAVTLSFTEVIPLPKKDVREIIEKSPKWINLLLHTLTERLEESINFVSEHSLTEDFDELNVTFSEEDEIRLRRALKEFKK